MLGLRDAVVTLTRIPLRVGDYDERRQARSVAWYPVVGALTGTLVGATALAAAWAGLPAGAAAVLAVTAELLLIGALHADGLADTADGLAGRDPEHRLAIMKDHAVGVYGVCTLTLAVLLKVLLLAELVQLGPMRFLGIVIGGYALSRAVIALPALLLSYPRAEGTGRAVVAGITPTITVLALLTGIVICAVSAAWSTPAMTVGALLATAAVGAYARARLGGATGDILGATAELALLATLIASLMPSFTIT